MSIRIHEYRQLQPINSNPSIPAVPWPAAAVWASARRIKFSMVCVLYGPRWNGGGGLWRCHGRHLRGRRVGSCRRAGSRHRARKRGRFFVETLSLGS